MPKEIERKFKINLSETEFLSQVMAGCPSILEGAEHMVQAYLPGDLTYRVRIVNHTKALLTIKTPSEGLSRDEFEYEIPVEDALQLLKHAKRPPLQKTRYKVPFGGFVWEVDFFQGELQGLAVAEIELPAEDTEFEAPAWLGEEVSFNPYYTNASIADKGHPEQAINYFLTDAASVGLGSLGGTSLLVTARGVESPLDGGGLLFRLHHERGVSKFYLDLLTCNGDGNQRFFEVIVLKGPHGFVPKAGRVDASHPMYENLVLLGNSVVRKHRDAMNFVVAGDDFADRLP